MATNFPTNIDTFTDQTSSDLITSAKWNNLQDSIEALEEKVGADNSAITTSHDYKLAELATTLGVITSAADVVDLEKLHALTSTHTEINQLHESGVVKADLVKLHDITVEAARINTIGKIKARAYRNAAQNINATSNTKVLIDTISFDTEGVVNITNSRIVPNLPGYYIAIANIRVRAVPDGQMVSAAILKNGALVTYGTMVAQGAEGYSESIAQDLVYMNGTTDYLELYAYNSHTSALALHVGYSYYNYISILGPF